MLECVGGGRYVFFKQKTGDELRISVWSSDVCSADLRVLDTGLLYRAVGYQTQLNHGDPDDARDALVACDFPDSLLDDPALRYESTGSLASRVSVHPTVRKALLRRQVDFANQLGGAVLAGRDLGTGTAPHAAAKLFVTASPEASARRGHTDRSERRPERKR